MKGKYINFYSIITIVTCLVMGVNGYGQKKNLEKSYEWSYQVNPDASFTFNNYDCDLIIHTWDKSEIAYTLAVDATLKSEEDASRLDAYIEKLEFSHAAGSVKFDNRFWTSKKAVLGKKTMTLKGEKTIRFSEFKMKGELWIPENCRLDISSKYSEIEVGDLNGRLNLDLYNDNWYGGVVKGNTQIAAKYSTLEFRDMNDVKADLYNSTLEAGNIGNLNVVSKYSKIKAGDAAKVDIDSYNDKYSLAICGDIRFIDKYSDLIAERSGHLELDCYNSTLTITQVEDVDLKSKYGSFEIEQMGNLNISSAYSDKYAIGTVKTLNILDSKYCTYRIDRLESSLYLEEGYSDKLYVESTGQLKEVKVNGKYVAVEMALDKELSYKFKADVKYPKFDLDEEAMNVRIKLKEGSQLKMEATKGAESEGMTSFFVNGYEMAITLTD